MNKLARLRNLELPAELFDGVSTKGRARVGRAAAEAPSSLAAHSERIRLMSLAPLCWSRHREVAGTLVDLLIGSCTSSAKAERRVSWSLRAD